MVDRNMAVWQMGENLDGIMNVDPRGYGMSRILYEGSRAYTKEPLTTNAAKHLISTLKKGDFVYIITGFILIPHLTPETDGMVSALLLARSLVYGFDAKPVIICPEECKYAVSNCLPVLGLHLYEDLNRLKDMPYSVGMITFSKDYNLACKQTEELIQSEFLPAAVIAIEAPGANEMGEYHNAAGNHVTKQEAKSDILFCKLQSMGILNIAIGDLGNEIGMGTIADHVMKNTFYKSKTPCNCSCRSSILAASKADHIITATVSDWGCYGLMAALAYLMKDLNIFHTGKLEKQLLKKASESGLIDMTGSLVPAIDGFSLKMNSHIVQLMRDCVEYRL